MPWSRLAILTAAALLCVHATLLGQAQFDVASVKENTSGDPGGTIRFSPDAGIRAQNVPWGLLSRPPMVCSHRLPISGMPRPRLIFRTRIFPISVCRGTASIAPLVGFVQRE